MAEPVADPPPTPSEPPAAAAAPPNAKAPSREPELDVLGGRFMHALLLLAGIAVISHQGLNVWIDRQLNPPVSKPAAVWELGKEARVQLTLVTADARRLNCAHDQELAGQHCGFTSNKHAWPRAPGDLADDNDAEVIQPYRTADTNALVLVSGVWAQPELAWRVHREPPSYYDIKKQVRFVAFCDVRFVGELENVALRWETGGKWLPEPKAMVAQALRCTLEQPSG
ncbi:MAG: hypothetical protein RL033_6784 [Pseudomonadota bacterium]|jgi:hypothetical protein